MYGNKLVFWWCCALLFVASSSKYHQNFTNSNERRDNKIKKNLTSNKFSETDSNKDSNFVPQEICINYILCETFCCHFEAFSNPTECIPGEEESLNAYKDMHYSLQSKNQDMNLTVYFLTYDPCKENKVLYLNQEDLMKNVFIANGTEYFPYQKKFVESKSFCLMDENKEMLRLECDIATFNTSFPTEIVSKILIYERLDPNNSFKSVINYYTSIHISMRIICILPLLTIFLVYSILPELHDKHGFILRNCIGAIIVAYIFESAHNLMYNTIKLRYFINDTMDSICYFGFLAIYFWPTVMSFDMWWTFRDISLAHMSYRQQDRERKMKERKKLIMYSVYAWGIPIILTIVCVIRNSVPPVMVSPLRPEFGIIIILLYFNEDMEALYYCIPLIICSVSRICLFISTALKIRRYEKNTTQHLRNVDSRVYDENKKWFNLCQKWFIMMFIVIGISASIGILKLMFPYVNIWDLKDIAYLIDMAQNIGIFIIFVCKKRIIKLLLTRFGYQNYNAPPRARQTEIITDSNTIRSRMTRLRERINLWQTNHRRNNMHDETAL